jgi:predicted nucleotidyltransferase
VPPDVDLQRTLREALADAPPLRLAILFGSGARGALRPQSDIDVGIVPRDPNLSLTAELKLQVRLERTCGRPVDLVRLDRASTLLRWEAARTGVLLVAESPHEFPRFVARAALEHADLMTVLAPAAERFRARLAAGGTAAEARASR